MTYLILLCFTFLFYANIAIFFFFFTNQRFGQGFPDSSVGQESACNAGDPGSIPGSGRSAGEGIGYPLQYSWASLMAQLVKNPPAMQETWVRSLGWEDLLEKRKTTHSSILAWRIPWTAKDPELALAQESTVASEKPVNAFFLIAFAHFISLRHILVILIIFQTFSLLLNLLGIFDVTTTTHQRLSWWLAFLLIKYFLFKVCTLFF